MDALETRLVGGAEHLTVKRNHSTNNDPQSLTGFKPLVQSQPGPAVIGANDPDATGGEVHDILTAEANQKETFEKIGRQLRADPRPRPIIAALSDISVPILEDFETKRIAALQLDDAQRLVNVLFDNIRLSDDCVLVSDVTAGFNLNSKPKVRGEKAPHTSELAPVATATRASINSPVPTRAEAVGIINVLRLAHEPLTFRAITDALRQGIDWGTNPPAGYETERVHVLISNMRDMLVFTKSYDKDTNQTLLSVRDLSWVIRFCTSALSAGHLPAKRLVLRCRVRCRFTKP